jgi:hypothetical protein
LGHECAEAKTPAPHSELVERAYDRLKDPGRPNRLPGVLAHVMAHEITHILQGVHRHSESGVMKAQWTRDDFNEMAFKPLTFTDTDVGLIRSGLDARETRMASRR